MGCECHGWGYGQKSWGYGHKSWVMGKKIKVMGTRIKVMGKKNGVPPYTNLVNLKSNTMKNTLQKYTIFL